MPSIPAASVLALTLILSPADDDGTSGGERAPASSTTT